MFLTYNFSPIQEVHSDKLIAQQLRLYLKRDDLLHPHISGNKWRKLKYNVLEMQRRGLKTLLTFGGAFSNHIAATAAAGQEFGFKTIGMIRGEEHLPLNPTLQYATECGMQLKYLSRADYRQKDTPEFQQQLRQQYGDIYLLPEGGTNQFALRGCAEIITETEQQLAELPDYFCVACGTGGTAAGMIQGLRERKKVIGFSVLKGNFITKEVKQLLQFPDHQAYSNWHINDEFHHDGYAKFTPELVDFINQFKTEHDIALDPIYTGKLLFGIFSLIERGFFPHGSSILAVHTGGLQGVEGFNQRFGNLLY